MYLEAKRVTVLATVGPILEAYGIDSYDYVIDTNSEFLRIRDTYIACTWNSLEAILDELAGYLFLNTHYRKRFYKTIPELEKKIKSTWYVKEDT